MGKDPNSKSSGGGGKPFGRGGKGKGKSQSQQQSPDKGDSQSTGRRPKFNRGQPRETPNKFHPYTITKPPQWSYVTVKEHLATKIAVDLGERRS